MPDISPNGDAPSWLVLIYRVPSEPTRLRATVWRRLKGLGAVYLQNSVAALPQSAAAERAMRLLRNEIQEMGGSAQLLSAVPLVGQEDVVARFNDARDEEYREVVARCQDFLDEIAAETAAAHFSYAELEENEEDLAKLRAWLEKVQSRDVLGAGGRVPAEAGLRDAQAAMEAFAEQVFAAEEHAHD